MIFKKMLFLFFTVLGLVTSTGFCAFLVSKRFREYVAAQVLKVTWPEKLGGAFSEDFFQTCEVSDAHEQMIFSKMGFLLESYDSRDRSPEFESEINQLIEHMKEYYQDLKACNAPQKKLRSIAYQMECIQAIIDSDARKRARETQGSEIRG